MNLSSIVSLKNIGITFIEKQYVLKDLSLEIYKGDLLSILGAGGSGKSTLLKTILGIIKPTIGSVSLFSNNINQLNTDESNKVRNKIGISFQQGALFDFMTVRENIEFAMENMTNFSKEKRTLQINTLLTQVNLPLETGDKLPSELSGGMRRRVGIIRAMCTNPELALLDDPAAGLDPVTSTMVINMIHRIGKAIESTMVCVTSNIDVAFRFANKVALLHDGKILASGSHQELLASQDPWIKNFLTSRQIKSEFTL